MFTKYALNAAKHSVLNDLDDSTFRLEITNNLPTDSTGLAVLTERREVCTSRLKFDIPIKFPEHSKLISIFSDIFYWTSIEFTFTFCDNNYK